MSITKQEFEYLMALKKSFDDSSPIDLTSIWSREISSTENNDQFILNYYKGSIKLDKYTFNKRFRKVIILLRFDSMGRHTNPDGRVFDGPHVHIYVENFDDKFAFPVSDIGIDENNLDRGEVLKRFLKYCNVENHPPIQTSLF